MALIDRDRRSWIKSRGDVRTSNEKKPNYSAMLATSGLCTLVALAPLPFASMDMRIVAVWVLLLSAVLLLEASQQISLRDLAFLCGFAAISLSWAFVVNEQLSQTSLLSKRLIAPIWEQTSAIIGEQLNGSVSVAFNQPFFSAGTQIACLLSMLCGYLVGRDRHAARLVLVSFLGSTLAYAIYGLIAHSFWPDYVLWQRKYNYLSSVTATFMNPNVAACYFGAAAIAWVLLFASTSSNHGAGPPLPWREWIRSRLYSFSPLRTLGLLACFAMLATTMLTASRAGSVLSLLCLAGALSTYFRRALKKRRLLGISPIAAILVVVGAISIFAPMINQRFAVQGFFDLGRWQTYVSTIEIIKDHPWLGSGLGTFRWVFPRYRSGDISSYGVWEQAHNSTLETAAEMGIPFTVVVGMGWLAALVVLFRGMLGRNRDAILPTAAFWIGLLTILHSQVDFPLQIPGFALAVCPILGMGMAQAFSSKARVLTHIPNRP
ncbi:O-antigen ligase family protein [Bradyrhizobium liaoningense]|uniref:O-antigen ligase family protein n=1 Tax=Bradyrhizobium liaoningense TaxID=43992 RepID=UPI001BA7E6DF|nr:O-antigen ligase family protein [Bradyrhizobium liaoningense]MBR1171008.1 O-antigen ligase family protein [Bradyrhizobium liaoningense]